MSEHKTSQEPSEIIMTDLYQSAAKIYIRRIRGYFRNLRFFGGMFLFAAYFGTLWLSWGDRQAVLFDLPQRQFHIFGVLLATRLYPFVLGAHHLRFRAIFYYRFCRSRILRLHLPAERFYLGIFVYRGENLR